MHATWAGASEQGGHGVHVPPLVEEWQDIFTILSGGEFPHQPF